MHACGLFRTGLAVGLLFALPAVLTGQHPTLQTPSQPTQAKPDAAHEPAQQPAGTAPTLSVDARLVNLPVVVRDKNGALVQNLTKADFVLEVDGKPQTIRYFDQDANLPLTLGLLVDTSLSQRKVLDEERSASSAFLDQMLTGAKDQAFVIQFAKKIELLQDLTGSRPKLQAALKDLDSAAPGNSADTSDPDDSGSGRRGRSNGGTALYDSVFLASDELMAKQKGRKAVILLTDGDDRGSKETISQAIETAQRADTIIYAIYFKGEQQRSPNDDNRRGGGFPGGGGGGYPGGGYPGGGRYPGGGGGYPGGGGRGGSNPGRQQEDRTDGRKVLERMAHETGGRMFEVSKKQSTADIYMEIGKELRAQYRLGYTPDQAAAGDGYHQIDLSLAGTDKKKLTIQTRDGYYTGK